jgi:hypothetical protein
MKRWLWLALAGLGVLLLLALGRPEAGRGVDSHPCLAGGARSVGPWGHSPPAPPTAAPAARKATPGQARTAPPLSRVAHLELLTERDVGSMWLDNRGPPGQVRGTSVDSRAAGQTGSPKQGGAYASPQGPSTP